MSRRVGVLTASVRSSSRCRNATVAIPRSITRQNDSVVQLAGRGIATRAVWPAGLFGSQSAVLHREVAVAVPASLRGVAVEAAQLRKGDFFDFKGKRCVVMKASQQINNRKAFAIVEFREIESGNKHKETIQAGDKVHGSDFNI